MSDQVPTVQPEHEVQSGRIRHNPHLKCPTCWVEFVVTLRSPRERQWLEDKTDCLKLPEVV
jgi:hypothetical protein